MLHLIMEHLPHMNVALDGVLEAVVVGLVLVSGCGSDPTLSGEATMEGLLEEADCWKLAGEDVR